jgi:farnesyl diphosphate synthase
MLFKSNLFHEMPSNNGLSLEDYFPKFRELILSSLEKRKVPDKARSWILKCIDYNLPGGKMTRAKAFLLTVDHFSFNVSLNNDGVLSLAWCIEFLQAFFLIADDIMDSSPIRRGRKCWHTLDSIGIYAINDVLLLQTILYILLNDVMSQVDNAFVLPVQMMFQEITLKTEIGQFFDLNVEKEEYSWDRVRCIAELKTAYYSFYLPVALGLLITKNDYLLREAERVLIPLGIFFQAQDDYLDFYGDPQLIGKFGTDIEEGKCSWLYLKALDLLSQENSQNLLILKDNYGKRDPKFVKIVKEIFADLKLDQHFKEYEERIKIEIMDLSTPPQLRSIFEYFCDRIFDRSK